MKVTYNDCMKTETAQIRVTLPVQLQAYLQAKANKYGLSQAAYIKNLIINDVQGVKYPAYEMSGQAIEDFQQAKLQEQEDSLVEAVDISVALERL